MLFACVSGVCMFNVNQKNLVHAVLGHSYILFFVSLLVGSFFDYFWPYRVHFLGLEYVGLFLLFLGPLIILWAQKTSMKTRQSRYTGESLLENFARGPYAITRSPTHYGIGLMFLGYSFVVGAPILMITTIVTLIFSKFIFLRKEERILSSKYGDHYKTYKQKVRF